MKKNYMAPEAEALKVILPQMICISEDDVDEDDQLGKERKDGENSSGLWSDSDNGGKLW